MIRSNKLNIKQIENIIDEKKDILYFYSPYNFIRSANRNLIYLHSVKNSLLTTVKENTQFIINVEMENESHYFIIKYLEWDSDYFHISTYKLITVLYSHDDYEILKKAVVKFKMDFFSQPKIYCFGEIPSEDTKLIKALGHVGFRMIETRVSYYMNNLEKYCHERFQVRKATMLDNENLKRIAREMRNDFDRFHADEVFDSKQGDEFLATYIESSLKGFADIVIVPDEKGTPPDAFLTANYLKDEWEKIGCKASKMVLSAVSSKTCKGWYKKLISEMTYHLKENGAEIIFMHPAITNRATIHVYESLGYKFGQASHIFSYCS